MTRVFRLALLVAMLAAACTPSQAAPPVPRPIVSAAAAPTTTAAPVASTTSEAIGDASEAGSACAAALCLTYHIDEAASWANGAPVTAEDFAHTVALHQAAPAGSGSGYDIVDNVVVIDEKTVMLELESRFGAWQGLFARVYRSGDTATSLPGTGTSGPFTFVEWAEGEHLTIARDLDWWSEADPISGAPAGDIAQIRFVFIDTPEEMVDALESGEVDVVMARPDAATMERLRAMDGVETALAPGPFWEHIDFHHDDPLLSSRWAREAIAHAIDREEILDRTVRLVDPDASVLDNTAWMSNSIHYQPHFPVDHDPERSRQLLAGNGCEAGDDGIQVCDGTRMSFVWASTNDDPDRAVILETVREDLAAVGIELVADLRSPSAFVTRDFLFGGPETWQMVNFSWRASADPSPSNTTYYCGGELNVNGFCDEEVEALVRSAGSIVDPGERAAVYNDADRIYLEDLALIPLYQKPDLMAWREGITGPAPNFAISGNLWNVATWTGPASIVVALPREPATLDPLSTADESANVILGPLMYGAHGMTPSHDPVPVLVDSVEVVEGEG